MIRTAIAACILLAGCTDVPLAMSPPPQPFDRLSAVTVERTADLAVPPGADALDAAARDMLAAFRAAQGTARGDRYTLIARTADDPRVELVARELGRATARGSYPYLPDGVVRVVLTRAVVTVAACPDWSGSSVEDFSNRAFSNHGCADAHNLAAQVANPQDLVAGGGGDPEARPLTDAVKRYRADRVKSLSVGGDLPFAVAAPAAVAP